jgi:hypothetical protein
MQHRKLSAALAGLALATASVTANADVLFQNLGTGAPPATVGSHTVTPFDQAPQAAIAGFSDVTVIPGGPGGATISVSPAANKRTIGSGWATWSHGYTGVVYYNNGGTTATLTLPAGTKAFYVYVEPNNFNLYNISAATDSGANSGAIPVNGSSGATGFAFHTTAGESIATITITADAGAAGFAFGEFGISTGPATTCASEGYTGTQLLWCKNICEKGYTGATLEMWIRRWLGRWRDLPYCAVEQEEPPPQEG